MSSHAKSFRIGKVHGYLRAQTWYLCYHDQGKRFRPRVGPNRDVAKQMAAQVNAQLEMHTPAALSYVPIAIPVLRSRWLEHHEQVLRSSLQTINRYRTATDHLLRFLQERPIRHAALFHVTHAEEFVKYLRGLKVSPNGHAHSQRRGLMDKGLKYILECCRALFYYAAKRRHLTPYSENPFGTLELNRIPVETSRPIQLFTPDQEKQFLAQCDTWQFPVFLALLLTGLRTGELCHLLLPEDLDLASGTVYVRNKPRLGWQVKTRNERDVPLHPVLIETLRRHLAGRQHGPVFLRRRFDPQRLPEWAGSLKHLERELEHRAATSTSHDGVSTRVLRKRVARRCWHEMGTVREDRVRIEFKRLTRKMGLQDYTAPKMLRHMFATSLQEGRVDSLIRNELMGHAASGTRSAGHGLAMTAVYTHTRPEVKRQQLLEALSLRPAIEAARQWLQDQ